MSESSYHFAIFVTSY